LACEKVLRVEEHTFFSCEIHASGPDETAFGDVAAVVLHDDDSQSLAFGWTEQGERVPGHGGDGGIGDGCEALQRAIREFHAGLDLKPARVPDLAPFFFGMERQNGGGGFDGWRRLRLEGAQGKDETQSPMHGLSVGPDQWNTNIWRCHFKGAK
jgi:hypothetical protein